jgi:hypothetical protein
MIKYYFLYKFCFIDLKRSSGKKFLSKKIKAGDEIKIKKKIDDWLE